MQFDAEMEAAASSLRGMGYETEKPNIVEGHAYGVGEYLDANVLLKRGFIDEHFRKIDRSDAILIVNHTKKDIEHYIGGNTLMEMTYAYSSGLDIFLLHPIPDMTYHDEIAALHPIVLDGDLSKVSDYFTHLPKVYISSESPVKHLAVSRGFRRAGIPVQTIAMPMPSGVQEQPSSMDETYEGALHRHEQLVKKAKTHTGDYLVTIESGIFTPRAEHNYFGCTTLVVEINGERHVGIDTDIEFPTQMTDKVPSQYKDLGALVQAEYGAKVSDPFPYLSNGRLNRVKIIENGLFNVIVQFSNIPNIKE